MGTSNATPSAVVAAAAISAMDQLAALFFVKDVERRFVHCTEALAHHLGYQSASQIVGLRDEDLSPPHLVEHYRRYDERVLRHGERIVELIELVRNTDGRYDWYTTTKWPLSDSRDKIIGLAGVTNSLMPRHPVGDDLLPLTPALELIAEQYHRKIGIAELAGAAAMSRSQFTREFKKRFGTTPHRYLRSVRLTAVCDLLCTTELPLSAIAHQTGYYDHSHLTNDFQREYRMSPSSFRGAHRRKVTAAGRPALPALRLRVALD